MHIYITSQDSWLKEGLRYAMKIQGVMASVTGISTVDEFLKHCDMFRLSRPADCILLPVFPGNQVNTCLNSLSFLLQWQALNFQNPCFHWGQTPLLPDISHKDRLTTIPWRSSPQELGQHVITRIQAWTRQGQQYSRSVRYRGAKKYLSSREAEVLRHTLNGRSLLWIGKELGVSKKTVWTHRRRALDVLGIRRIYDLIKIPPNILYQINLI